MDSSNSNMLAIIEQTDLAQSRYTDNTTLFFLLMLLKVCLDFGGMYLCYIKPLQSFLNMCSIFIVVADLILTVFMSATLWLDVQTSHTTLCFIMAYSSAAYSTFPVPVFCLGILDYYLQDTWAGKKCIKLVRNSVSVSLIWIIAVIYSHVTVDATLVEKEMNIRYLVCEIQESKVVAYSVVTLFTLTVFVLLPYMPQIPKWVKVADQISEARETTAETKTSDLKTVTPCTKEDPVMPRPPMHISLVLGFGVFWMPYLAITTLCVVFENGIPAYITVNLLWVQCVNSLLAGILFWLRSNTVGPYCSLLDNVCLWQTFWHLSTGTEAHQQLPAKVFNPSKRKGSTPFYV